MLTDDEHETNSSDLRLTRFDLETASADDLETRMDRLLDPRTRQTFRFLLIRCANILSYRGNDARAKVLSHLAVTSRRRLSADWCATPQALEVLPPTAAPLSAKCREAIRAIEPSVQRELDGLASVDVGRDQETKFRFVELTSRSDALEIGLSPTSWREGRGFHLAVLERPDRFAAGNGSWIVPLPLGGAVLPGLAVVHAIVVTADNQLLMAQRSAKVGYAPHSWSASFEEQITADDVGDGSRVFHRAAQRGLFEEFGVRVEQSACHLISVVLQTDNLNLGAVLLLQIRQTFDDVCRSRSRRTQPSHAWETEALASMEADPDELEALGGESLWRGSRCHPSTPIRFALLARWLRAHRGGPRRVIGTGVTPNRVIKASERAP